MQTHATWLTSVYLVPRQQCRGLQREREGVLGRLSSHQPQPLAQLERAGTPAACTTVIVPTTAPALQYTHYYVMMTVHHYRAIGFGADKSLCATAALTTVLSIVFRADKSLGTSCCPRVQQTDHRAVQSPMLNTPWGGRGGAGGMVCMLTRKYLVAAACNKHLQLLLQYCQLHAADQLPLCVQFLA